MTLQKRTLDNSFVYVSTSQSENLPKDLKPKTASLPIKQNKKFSRSKKKFNIKIARERYRNYKWTMNCYFQIWNIQMYFLENKTKPVETPDFMLNKSNETF